jgi:hypothetical protein
MPIARSRCSTFKASGGSRILTAAFPKYPSAEERRPTLRVVPTVSASLRPAAISSLDGVVSTPPEPDFNLFNSRPVPVAGCAQRDIEQKRMLQSRTIFEFDMYASSVMPGSLFVKGLLEQR